MPDCITCGQHCKSQRDLDKHLNKKYPCTKAPHHCVKCHRPYYNKSSFYHHQKHCAGQRQTPEQKDEEIQHLKNTLLATSGLNQEIKDKRQKVTNNNIQNNCISIGEINNITQNIVILPSGSENINHLKGMSLQDLKNKIGLNNDPSTHIEAFKLVRLDPDHPENHNILLTDRDSDRVHYYADDKTWHEGDYTYELRNAIYDTNKNIQHMIPYQDRGDYYWNHLEWGIGQNCNMRNDLALKPIFDGIRDPLHKATLRLMNKELSPDESSRPVSPNRQSSVHCDAIAIVEREKTLRKMEDTKQEQEKTRQLELQLELARLQASYAR